MAPKDALEKVEEVHSQTEAVPSSWSMPPLHAQNAGSEFACAVICRATEADWPSKVACEMREGPARFSMRGEVVLEEMRVKVVPVMVSVVEDGVTRIAGVDCVCVMSEIDDARREMLDKPEEEEREMRGASATERVMEDTTALLSVRVAGLVTNNRDPCNVNVS